MNKKSGFTLLEVLVAVLVIGIVSLSAVSVVFSDLPKHKVKEDIYTVQQALIIARSSAVKSAKTIITDFSLADSNNGESGGVIQIVDLDGNLIDSFVMNKNVLFNSSSSTIDNNEVRFDYLGQPVDSTGDINAITTDNNKIIISFYKSGTAVASKSLEVTPVSGSAMIE